MSRLLLYPLAALVLLPSTARAEHPNVDKGPVPSWVDPLPLPDDLEAPDSAAGVHWLVVEDQHRFGGAAGVERYYRSASLVLSPQGVSNASRVSVELSPSYQDLTLHHVRVIRDGEARDELVMDRVLTAEVESDARARIYHGAISASLEIPDVRVGDIVEYAYTVRGQNPVMKGHIATIIWLQSSRPIAHRLSRMLIPRGREVAVQAVATSVAPERRDLGRYYELRHEQRDQPALEVDTERPAWHEAWPRFRLSTFENWNQLARWEAQLYRRRITPRHPEIREIADRIASQHASAVRRTRAATTFVQEQVRYVGIEIGSSSLQPHPAPQVLKRRFGDCKDKSVLLVSLLRAMGIEADPVLVHSTRGVSLDDWLPSPRAFDHVIVRAALDHESVWIDPTASGQRGDWFDEVSFRRALPIRADARQLEVIPAPILHEPSLEVYERFSRGDDEGEYQLTVRSIYRDDNADGFRRRLGSETRDEIAGGYAQFYAELYPSIERVGDLEIDDDTSKNEIRVVERYTLNDLFKDGRAQLLPREVTSNLYKPAKIQRTSPYALSHPVHVRQTITVEVAPSPHYETFGHRVSNDFFDYAFNASYNAGEQTVELNAEIRTKQDHVPASRIDEYVADVDEASDNSSYELIAGANAAEIDPLFDGMNRGIGLAIIAAILLGTLVLIILLNRRPSRPPPDYAAPYAPPQPWTTLASPAASQPMPQAPPRDPEPEPSNGAATASIWLGLVAMQLCMLPVVNVILAVLAVVFGRVGLRRAAELGGFKLGSAKGGFVLGLVGLALSAVFFWFGFAQGEWVWNRDSGDDGLE